MGRRKVLRREIMYITNLGKQISKTTNWSVKGFARRHILGQKRLAWALFALLLSTLVCCLPTELIGFHKFSNFTPPYRQKAGQKRQKASKEGQNCPEKAGQKRTQNREEEGEEAEETGEIREEEAGKPQ